MESGARSRIDVWEKPGDPNTRPPLGEGLVRTHGARCEDYHRWLWEEQAQKGYDATKERVNTARAGQELLDKGATCRGPGGCLVWIACLADARNHRVDLGFPGSWVKVLAWGISCIWVRVPN